MTTVTKIFIVLVCLFAFIFTPMAISFAARTWNWRALAERYRDDAETALALERSTIATAASTVEHYTMLRDQESRRADDAESHAADLEQENMDLTQKGRELERGRDSWENSARTLSEQMKVINTHNAKLIEENQRLAHSESDLLSKNIDLNDRVAELSANNVILARYLGQRKEELAAVRKENEQLREALQLGQAGGELLTSISAPSARAIAPPARGEIRGTVTEFREAQELASINVGSASGVTEGMVMVVIRGDEYICDLVITGDVNPTEAVGRVTSRRGKRVRPGDVVIDEPSFTAR